MARQFLLCGGTRSSIVVPDMKDAAECETTPRYIAPQNKHVVLIHSFVVCVYTYMYIICTCRMCVYVCCTCIYIYI